MKLLLYDFQTTNRRGQLEGALRSEWDIISLPDVRDRTAVRAALADVDAFVGSAFPADLAGAGQHLCLVHCTGAGTDQMARAALPPGCVLCNVYEHEGPMAEYILMVMLMFATGVVAVQQALREGRWVGSGRADGVVHGELAGATLGLVGYGHIGRAAAARAKALGVRVIAAGRSPQQHPDLDEYLPIGRLDDLLAASDYVAIVCPLTDETRGLISARQLEALGPEGVLINVARAEIVNEADLYTALAERRIAGAALDVWYQYPAHPHERMHGSGYPFHDLPNVIATPHFSAWTTGLLERRFTRIAENLDRLAAGLPLQRIVYRAGVRA